MYFLHLDDKFQKEEALNKPRNPALEDSLLHLRSSKGFPVYNSYYKDVENYVLGKVAAFNNNLRKNFILNMSKSSALIDLENPSMKYYKDMFPQKQLEIPSEKLFMKPACCAVAFQIWASKKTTLKKKEIMHELSDCYRCENLGTVRTFKRNCYFTMPDYHMITIQNQVEEDFKKVRSQLLEISKSLFGPDWVNNFHEVIRVDAKSFDKYSTLINYISETSVSKVFVQKMTYEETSKPYYGLKYELAYRGASSLFTLGTLQIDYHYPKLFNLDTSVYGDRVALHFSPGSIQRIVEVLIKEERLPFKGVKLYCISGQPVEVMKDLNLKCSYLIERGTMKEALRSTMMEKEFFPLLVIVGPKQQQEGSVSVADRVTLKNRTYPLEQFRAMINENPLYMDSSQIHYSNTFCNRDIFF